MGGSLESRAPDLLTGACLSWSWLARGPPAGTAPTAVPCSPGSRGFPLLCLGVKGSDNHLPDSPEFLERGGGERLSSRRFRAC